MKKAIAASAAALLASFLAACDPHSTLAEPDATGTVVSVSVSGSVVSVAFDPDPGYEYFEGTVFVLDGPIAGVDPSKLLQGDSIAVWTNTCAESFPVQCAVQRIELAADD